MRVGGEAVARCGTGLLLLVGVGAEDDGTEIPGLAAKIAGLRVFEDADGKMNLSLDDVSGEVLVVPNFTLYGDVGKGRRPSWTGASPPEVAEERVEALCRKLEEHGATVHRGVFGADMEVELVNDGPVTLVLQA